MSGTELNRVPMSNTDRTPAESAWEVLRGPDSWFAACRPSDAVDASVERENRAYPGRFCLCDEISLREVEPVYLVDLECAQQRLRVDRPDRWERDRGAHELRHARARNLVERLEYVDALGNDKFREQQLGLGFERRRRARCQLWRIAGQVANENVGV